MKNVKEIAVVLSVFLASNQVFANTSKNISSSADCSEKALSAAKAYASIFCQDFCKILPESIKIVSAVHGQQDEPTTFVVQIKTQITGANQTLDSTSGYQLTVGYSKPPSHFQIPAQCNVWGDIAEIE